MSNRRRLLVQPNRRRQTADESEDVTESATPPFHLDDLPPYQPLELPLNDAAVRSVAELSNNRTITRMYDSQLKRSAELLREAVGGVNDLYTERKSDLQRMTERRRDRTEQPTRAFMETEKSVEKLAVDVPSITQDIEHNARLIIDLQVELEDEHDALTWVNTQIISHQQADRQRKRLREQKKAQRQERIDAARQRRAAGNSGNVKQEWDNDEGADDDDDDDEHEGEESEEDEELPTGVVDLLQKARKTRADAYAQMNAHSKYGINNDYVSFKQVWHDAVYPDGDVRLPDASNWFDAAGEPLLYGPDGVPGAGGDSDEDLIVAREVISFKCPLTLRTMTDPYKSKLCNHTFEKQGIMEYLQGGPKKCPQTGCDKNISRADLVPDNVMRRRIERAEEVAQRDDAAATSDVDAEMGDDDTDDADAARDRSVVEERARNIKRERFTRPQQE